MMSIPIIFYLLKHPVEADTVLIECDCRDGRNSASSIARTAATNGQDEYE